MQKLAALLLVGVSAVAAFSPAGEVYEGAIVCLSRQKSVIS
jgi:hypothetical protein